MIPAGAARTDLGLRPLRKVHLTLNDATPAEACRVQKVVRAWLQHVARASHSHSAWAKLWAKNICSLRQWFNGSAIIGKLLNVFLLALQYIVAPTT